MILNNSVAFFFQCVGEDIEDLEYTPKPEFEGYFKVTNVQNEVMVFVNPWIMGISYMLFVCWKSVLLSCFIVMISYLFRFIVFFCWFMADYFFGRLSFLDCGFHICKRWNLVSMWHTMVISLIGHSWSEGQLIMGSKWVMYVASLLLLFGSTGFYYMGKK